MGHRPPICMTVSPHGPQTHRCPHGVNSAHLYESIQTTHIGSLCESPIVGAVYGGGPRSSSEAEDEPPLAELARDEEPG